MKQVLFSLVTVLLLKSVAQAHGTIVVEIEEGHSEEGGSIHLFLFDSEKSWQDDTPKNLGKISSVVATKGHLTFDLPAHQYSITAFQDMNNNESLDKNLIGIPQERFAISNVNRTLWSPPDWTEVKFLLKEGETKYIKLHFKYQ